ncbi:LysR family transcriptional regulator [Veillonella agrestimuris]|uniref:LysR family transcriptional regulator n=1 Tax=Veillonella agrestimuris TaxID=2941340 RepID=UPI00203EC6B1|nr:LysR family transcriptional regulator [Veillonella agrestimuris]
MDDREWRTFVTVVDEGNITKAAEKLFISQPALSYRLRNMEETVGHSLVLRTAEGITLTPQGEIYYEYCKRMIHDKETLEYQLLSSTGKIQGTLKIASSINFADYELPLLLKSFREQYPDVHIQVKTAYSQQIVKMFKSGECMVAFARGGYEMPGQSELLLEEPYCLVYKDLVAPKELAKVPFIRYQTDVSVTNIIENWCDEHFEGPPTVGMEVNSMSTCRHFVRAGLGWSILPYMGLGTCKDRDIYVSPLRDMAGNLITRDTHMIYTKEASNLVAVKTFIDYVRTTYKQQSVVDHSIFREYGVQS